MTAVGPTTATFLFVVGELVDPDLITETLVVTPTDQHRRGDLNERGFPWREGFWEATTPLPSTASLADQVASLLDVVEAHSDRWRRMAAEMNWGAAVQCNRYADDHGRPDPGLSLPWRLAGRLAQLGLDLSIEYFPPLLWHPADEGPEESDEAEAEAPDYGCAAATGTLEVMCEALDSDSLALALTADPGAALGPLGKPGLVPPVGGSWSRASGLTDTAHLVLHVEALVAWIEGREEAWQRLRASVGLQATLRGTWIAFGEMGGPDLELPLLRRLARLGLDLHLRFMPPATWVPIPDEPTQDPPQG